MTIICDCGRWLPTVQDAEACAANQHRDGRIAEVEDALATVPEQFRDAHWHAARQRLTDLVKRGVL